MPLTNPILLYSLGIILSCGLAVFAFPPLIFAAKKKRLFDTPDSDRKFHMIKTPNLGGIVIFCVFAFVMSLFGTDQLLPSWNYVLAASFILFATGIKDDIIGLDPVKKFLAQFIAAFLIAYFADIRIVDFNGFLGIHIMPYWISIGFTVIGIMFVTNAFNLIDGIDGLAGGMGLLICTLFGIYFAAIEQAGYALMALSMAGTLVGFLWFNVQPARIFMGDTGSLLIGFISSILCIHFARLGNVHPEAISGSAGLVVAVGIIFIPVFDTFRVFINRIFNGKSPFRADRHHIHHVLIDMGLSHSQVCTILLTFNVFFILLAFLVRTIPPSFAIGLLFVSGIASFQILRYFRNRHEQGRHIIPVSILKNKERHNGKIVAFGDPDEKKGAKEKKELLVHEDVK